MKTGLNVCLLTDMRRGAAYDRCLTIDTVKPMTHSQDDACQPLTDGHGEELKARVDALRELIIEMVACGEDTTSQSELLYTLVRAITSMKATKAKGLGALSDADRGDQAGSR